ncbi:putative addiction module killer protein [Luteitalea pratensis]|uniref:Putative addiction module killer protein n=1 Tax=Luteitalea pratensis TaxID=1855912 RepID=A0A143PGN2_LUTPR|nr:type II toxin-antitoxin system RelE/ParE family toxin [Luteitalea pratensis]AMY07413.1 putative addiction module killer protein [Luteitalea pratensis]
MKVRVREFVTAGGAAPYREWLLEFDRVTPARIQARVLRFEDANFGDVRSVGGGVLEARVMFGAGYRIYFGRHRVALVLLLVGGSKASQTRDIRLAQVYWREYLGGK